MLSVVQTYAFGDAEQWSGGIKPMLWMARSMVLDPVKRENGWKTVVFHPFFLLVVFSRGVSFCKDYSSVFLSLPTPLDGSVVPYSPTSSVFMLLSMAWPIVFCFISPVMVFAHPLGRNS